MPGPERWRRQPRRHARQLTDVVGPGCLLVEAVGADRCELVVDRCWALGATAMGETDVGLEVGFPTDADAEADRGAISWPGGRSSGSGRRCRARPSSAALEAWRPLRPPVRVGALHMRPAWLRSRRRPAGSGGAGRGRRPLPRVRLRPPEHGACLEAVVDLAGPGVRRARRRLRQRGARRRRGRPGGPVVAVDMDGVAVAATAAAAAGGVVVEVSTRAVGEDGALRRRGRQHRPGRPRGPRPGRRCSGGARRAPRAGRHLRRPGARDRRAVRGRRSRAEGRRGAGGVGKPGFLGKSTFSAC